MYERFVVRASLCFALAVAVLPAGCQRIMDWVVPDDADLRARHYLELLAAGQVDSVEQRLAPHLRNEGTREQLAAFSKYLPSPSFDTVEIVSANTKIVNRVRRVTVHYQISGERRAYAQISTLDSGGTWTIETLNVGPR